MSERWVVHQFEDEADRWVGEWGIAEGVLGPFTPELANRIAMQLNAYDAYRVKRVVGPYDL